MMGPLPIPLEREIKIKADGREKAQNFAKWK